MAESNKGAFPPVSSEYIKDYRIDVILYLGMSHSGGGASSCQFKVIRYRVIAKRRGTLRRRYQIKKFLASEIVRCPNKSGQRRLVLNLSSLMF